MIGVPSRYSRLSRNSEWKTVSPPYQTAPPPYSCTRVRAFAPGGVSSRPAESTTAVRPSSSGRASLQRMRPPRTSTCPYPGFPDWATVCASTEDGQVPYGRTVTRASLENGAG